MTTASSRAPILQWAESICRPSVPWCAICARPTRHASLPHLAMKRYLCRFGYDDLATCPSCPAEDEDAEHVLFCCPRFGNGCGVHAQLALRLGSAGLRSLQSDAAQAFRQASLADSHARGAAYHARAAKDCRLAFLPSHRIDRPYGARCFADTLRTRLSHHPHEDLRKRAISRAPTGARYFVNKNVDRRIVDNNVQGRFSGEVTSRMKLVRLLPPRSGILHALQAIEILS
ncbi:unnamed protein product [Trichogramma brassicae]|uniref:Reverse transcriptase zinc-binding domain-containing protein n=1 Tax=Trichogramma brassicae TaxID=86971 RepID=A0A6H5IL76_9HYME|nr:unnamed protein product [Trichogramma brassicae]